MGMGIGFEFLDDRRKTQGGWSFLFRVWSVSNKIPRREALGVRCGVCSSLCGKLETKKEEKENWDTTI